MFLRLPWGRDWLWYMFENYKNTPEPPPRNCHIKDLGKKVIHHLYRLLKLWVRHTKEWEVFWRVAPELKIFTGSDLRDCQFDGQGGLKIPQTSMSWRLLPLWMVQPVMFNIFVKQLCNNLKRLIFNIFPSNSKQTSIVDHFICYSLPLSFQPLLVVGHLDTAVGHLTNTQDLEHQDSKRPNIAPEYKYLLPDLFIEERVS